VGAGFEARLNQSAHAHAPHNPPPPIPSPGAIGSAAALLFIGIGCTVTAYDVAGLPPALAAAGVAAAPDLASLLAASDLVSLHVPLLPSTRKLIDAASLAALKPGAALINVSRGALVDTAAVTRALEEGRLGGFAADVYEGESALFFQDWGDSSWASRVQRGGWDPVLSYLLSFPNVIMTPHSAFLTHEALAAIKASVLASIGAFAEGRELVDEVKAKAK
jgi:D-lactate dehydrogenase